MLSQKELKELLHYNPDNGLFTWRIRPAKKMNVGDIAGGKTSKGYVNIRINGIKTIAHRLAFLYMTGGMPEQVDHINRKRDDNRWKNLRASNNSKNQRNITLSKNNSSGFNGVSFNSKTKKYVAYIRVNSKQKTLGHFDELSEAIIARQEANIKYGYSSGDLKK